MNKMKKTWTLINIPLEILMKIIGFLDIQSIDQLELVTPFFKQIIQTSIHIWRQKIVQFCQTNSQFKNVIKYSEYHTIKKSSKCLRNYFNCLIKIMDNLNSGKCRKKYLNCLDAELNGRQVVQNSEWNRRHNYRGVYDMVYDEGRLCVSVYDTIQIWDTRNYRLTHLFNKEILDQDRSQTTCFTLYKDYLICGTENGYIKLIDINSEKVVTRSRVNTFYLSDIKYKNGALVSLDWFGNIQQWKVLPGPQIQNTTGGDGIEVPLLLQDRDIERLLDFDDSIIISTYKCHISRYRNGEFDISVPVYTDVFCIDKQDNYLAFGCKGSPRTQESANPCFAVAGIINLSDSVLPRIVYFRTKDNDPVISVQLKTNYLILGDVNGEIHIVNISGINFNGGETFVDLEEGRLHPSGCHLLKTLKSHGYRDFIWSLKFDGFRIFSGDETGKIIVHDFLCYDDDSSSTDTAEADADADQTSEKCQNNDEPNPNDSLLQGITTEEIHDRTLEDTA